MATITTGNTVSLTDQEHRNQTAAILPPTLLPLAVRGGVHSGLNISKTSGMGFSISPGRAIVQPASPSAGPYVVTVTTAEALTFAPGDSTRNRIDVVAVKVDETVGTANPGDIVIIQGAYPASGVAQRPAIPAGHEALFHVPINAGMSAGNGGWTANTAVDLRRQLTTLGGIIPVNSVAERDALDPYNGLVAMRLDRGGSMDRYVAGKWKGNSDWVDVPMMPGWRPTVANVGVQLKARILADGLLGEVSGELILPEPYGMPVEDWIMGTLPAFIKPAENSWILGTSNNYTRAQVFYVRGDGTIRIGPYPSGRVMQFHGIFPLAQ
jgi:hypothetical protein